MSTMVTQASNLDVHEVPDGYIVYQKERDRGIISIRRQRSFSNSAMGSTTRMTL